MRVQCSWGNARCVLNELETLSARAYCDDGVWRQALRLVWSLLTHGRITSFPPKGFVGQVSGSLAGSDVRRLRRVSIHLRHLPLNRSIWPVRLWRLTYVWEMHRPVLPLLNFGHSSQAVGASKAVGGVVTSETVPIVLD